VRIVLVTGIFPPDIGGPATHTADLREALEARGHAVTVLTFGDGVRTAGGPGIVRFSRRWPLAIRQSALSAWLVRRAREYDVVYATGLHPAAVAGARLAGRPVVVKVVGDLAWERGGRLGLTSASFEAFQAGEGRSAVRVRAMRRLQNAALRAADEVTVPSEPLRDTVRGWLGGPAPVRVIPNGVRRPPTATERSGGAPFLFVGRLVPVKRVDRIVEAVALVPGARLEVIGDGPEADALSSLVRARGLGRRVALRGPLEHDEVRRSLAGAAALVLASEHEGLPHVVLEALASGTPVLAPPVGAVADVVEDGESGLIVPNGSVAPLAAAMRRVLDDDELATRLRDGAARAGRRWSIERTAEEVEELLGHAIRGRPRAVFLGKARVSPGDAALVGRTEVLARHVRTTLVGTGRAGIRRLGTSTAIALPELRSAAVESAIFYAAGPLLSVAITAGRRRSAIVCQSPYEAIGTMTLTRLLPSALRPRVVVELHGDWRSASRLYGDPAREALAPLADRLATAALLRADRVRAVGSFTESLAREVGWRGETDRFPAFSRYDLFLGSPPVDPPDAPRVLYVGALERAKGIDLLLDAWPDVARRRPDAALAVVGAGSLEQEVRDRAVGLAPAVVRLIGAVDRDEVKTLLDRAAVVVVPSRSEGLGRVVLEAFARGRPVVGTCVGGIPELVLEGERGLLVPSDDAPALAAGIVRLLDDPDAAAEMGRRGRVAVERIDPAAGFDAGIERLARWIDAR
jgi:glycosyltransferase involved in cell wall biosynthesis